MRRRRLMRKIKWLVHLPLICLIAGCSAAAGRYFATEGIPRISLGVTTEQEISGYFGSPYSTITKDSEGLESLIYVYMFAKAKSSGEGSVRALSIEFIDNVVNGYTYESSFAEDNTDFEDELRSQLETGKTTMADAEALIGKPGGVVRFPTNLLSIKSLPQEVQDSVSIAWTYVTQYSEKRQGDIRIPSKKFPLLFNDEETLIYTDYIQEDM
jgi:hypothetical protein